MRMIDNRSAIALRGENRCRAEHAAGFPGLLHSLMIIGRGAIGGIRPRYTKSRRV
jgi:hypothetical protein